MFQENGYGGQDAPFAIGGPMSDSNGLLFLDDAFLDIDDQDLLSSLGIPDFEVGMAGEEPELPRPEGPELQQQQQQQQQEPSLADLFEPYFEQQGLGLEPSQPTPMATSSTTTSVTAAIGSINAHSDPFKPIVKADVKADVKPVVKPIAKPAAKPVKRRLSPLASLLQSTEDEQDDNDEEEETCDDPDDEDFVPCFQDEEDELREEMDELGMQAKGARTTRSAAGESKRAPKQAGQQAKTKLKQAKSKAAEELPPELILSKAAQNKIVGGVKQCRPKCKEDEDAVLKLLLSETGKRAMCRWVGRKRTIPKIPRGETLFQKAVLLADKHAVFLPVKHWLLGVSMSLTKRFSKERRSMWNRRYQQSTRDSQAQAMVDKREYNAWLKHNVQLHANAITALKSLWAAHAPSDGVCSPNPLPSCSA